MGSLMKLKKYGAFLVNLVIDFANGNMSCRNFDLDYSGYVIEHFPSFEREHPRLSRRFVDTIDLTYDTCSWMEDDAMDGDEPVLFAYTCDMPRIKRFDNALHIHDMRGTLYCFDFQEAALRAICGPGIKIQDLDFEKVKALLFDGDC